MTVCAFTSDPTEAPLIRLEVEPDAENGLATTGRLMIDKITTIPRHKLGTQIRSLSDRDMTRFGRAIVALLGLAGS